MEWCFVCSYNGMEGMGPSQQAQNIEMELFIREFGSCVLSDHMVQLLLSI